MAKDIACDRRRFLGIAATTIAVELGLLTAAQAGCSPTTPADPPAITGERVDEPMTPVAGPLPIEGELPALDGATGWLNSPPLTADGLRGRVVLIDFWTYTCVNWLRTLPYVRAWSER